MKRKEAKQMFRDDKDSYGKPKAIMSKIDKIYDEFDNEIIEFGRWLLEIKNKDKVQKIQLEMLLELYKRRKENE